MANIPGAVSDPSRVRGEDVEIKSGGDTITGYLARPSQSANNPGIVVIHEAFGLVEHIRDVARRFANIGYDALAPDLYARAGGPSNPNDMATVMPVSAGVRQARRRGGAGPRSGGGPSARLAGAPPARSRRDRLLLRRA